MNLRMIVGIAAVAMFVVEVVAGFVEVPLAGVLSVVFLLGAVWLWYRRDSIWPVAALGVLFLLEIIYLSDYDWNDATDRAMIVVTIAVSGVGLLAVIGWFIQRRRIT
jgi:hypothetical protein